MSRCTALVRLQPLVLRVMTAGRNMRSARLLVGSQVVDIQETQEMRTMLAQAFGKAGIVADRRGDG